MKLILSNARLLYALTAILLLMQALAIWHDSEHPFHHTTQECVKFQTLGHTPAADIATTPNLIEVTSTYSIEQSIAIVLVEDATSAAHLIRAPPHSIS